MQSSDALLEVPAEINDAIELLRENRTRLEKAMTKRLAFDPEHADAANKLAAAIKSLSGEARLWADQFTERASKATPEQRTAACIKHLTHLPQGPRLGAYRALSAAEKHNVQVIGLVVVTDDDAE